MVKRNFSGRGDHVRFSPWKRVKGTGIEWMTQKYQSAYEDDPEMRVYIVEGGREMGERFDWSEWMLLLRVSDKCCSCVCSRLFRSKGSSRLAV